MADKLKADNEPSIEEILDSIRQIISEDEKSDAVDAPPVAVEVASAQPAQAPALNVPSSQNDIDDIFAEIKVEEDIAVLPEEDVIELIDRVEPDPVFFKNEEVSVAKVEEPPFVVDLIDETIKDEEEPLVKEVERELSAEPKIKADIIGSEDSILTHAAENAAFSAITELARRTAVEHGGITVEEIVRSELKPLLRGWLDKNLPVVIERLVKEELERVSKRVLED